jgi:predicted metalloprotease with PDZ domain
MTVSQVSQKELLFKLPVWTPGSYLVREYARHVESVTATDGKEKITVQKVSKNTWKITTPSSKNVTVRYRVYAYELTVRTSFLDDSHAYINGASVFMYVHGMEKKSAILSIEPHPSFKKITTALKPIGNNPFELQVPDYDTLVDSPVEIGNHATFSFTAAGVWHQVAMYGNVSYDEKRLKKDMAKIVETTTAIFGSHPCKEYVFIVHHVPNGGGGLEHSHSTSLLADIFTYQDEKSYQNFLALVAHEYFHLWNVKRVRPTALGPFNYEAENYTYSLWQAEGFTSYYDDYILLRAGLMTEQEYLSVATKNINGVEQTPGKNVQSVAEASFDAWIKYYRPDENSRNSRISYYTKGGVLAMLLDWEIRYSSKNQYSLDNVMQYLYTELYQKQNRGFTEKELQQVVEKFAGKKLDDFFTNYVYDTKPIDYPKYASYIGLELVDKNENSKKIFWGASHKVENGKILISGVLKGTTAYNSGVNVNDELIALNNYRITDDNTWNKLIATQKVGDKDKLLVSRNGYLKEINITWQPTPMPDYSLRKSKNISEEQNVLLKNWLLVQ